MPGEQALCAPTDDDFQSWLSGLKNRSGADCEDAAAPPASRSAPRIRDVSLVSYPRADGAYRAGEAIEVTLRFSEAVTVSGAPRLRLGIGAASAAAVYVPSGAGALPIVPLHRVPRRSRPRRHQYRERRACAARWLHSFGGENDSRSESRLPTQLPTHPIIPSTPGAPAAERSVLTDALAAQGRAPPGEHHRGDRPAICRGALRDAAPV